MSLAKQIGSVAKTALTNAGHMNMNNEIYARILDTTVAALHLRPSPRVTRNASTGRRSA